MDKSKTVIALREERNARLIPRDPRRAAEYDRVCAEIVEDAKQRIADGEDALEDLDRSRKLLQQRKRSGLCVVRSSTDD